MKDIAIFGAGGFGREVFLILQRFNKVKKKWNFLGFFDDDASIDFGTSKIPFNYLGSINELNQYDKPLSLVIALGQPSSIIKVVKKIDNNNIDYPNIISTDTIIYDDNIKIGKGNIITSGCIFTDNITIGDFNAFNSKISVGHDVIIGNYNVFNPNTAISGNVKIGDSNFWGLNSSVIQGKVIGSNNKIGASTLMIRNAKDNESYFGIPGYKSL